MDKRQSVLLLLAEWSVQSLQYDPVHCSAHAMVESGEVEAEFAVAGNKGNKGAALRTMGNIGDSGEEIGRVIDDRK